MDSSLLTFVLASAWNLTLCQRWLSHAMTLCRRNNRLWWKCVFSRVSVFTIITRRQWYCCAFSLGNRKKASKAQGDHFRKTKLDEDSVTNSVNELQGNTSRASIESSRRRASNGATRWARREWEKRKPHDFSVKNDFFLLSPQKAFVISDWRSIFPLYPRHVWHWNAKIREWTLQSPGRKGNENDPLFFMENLRSKI